MLDARTKQTIDNACDTLVGRVPSPQTQVDIITTALIYKFMDDMDLDGLELSGKRTFFVGDLEPYAFSTVVNTKGNQERMNLYLTGLEKVQIAKSVPELFRRIFKEANIPFRDPTTFTLFLKEINELKYDDSEKIGDAFEYLLNKMATAKNAGQFRTPRNIIDFIVDVVKPTKDDTILDPACGTAGFLISAYKHITSGGKLTPDELKRVTNSIVGMDIDPTMVKLSLVNLYLHKFEQPNIYEYDTLSNDTRWGDRYDVILANPPFMTPKGGITPHKRFAINANRSEVLFVDYFMEHLTINGRAGFVVPEGIVSRGEKAYKDLRKMMLDGYLYAVVSLPSGVFNPYSGVKTSILFFDRTFVKTNDNILFVRVDNDGFSLGAQRTPIKQNDLPEALKIINEYREGKDVSGYERAMVVSKERIAENNYDLTAAKYIEKETRECKYEMVKLGEICEFVGKGKRPASFGGAIGKMPFFVSSIEAKRCDIADYDGEYLIIGDGGYANVHYVNGPFSASDHTYILKTVKNSVLLKYIYQVLNGRLDLVEAGFSGAGLKNVSKTYLKNIEIPLPPLDMQQQILSEIEKYQAIIDGATQIIKNWKPGYSKSSKWKELKIGDAYDVSYGVSVSIPANLDDKGIDIISTAETTIDGYLDLTNIRKIKMETKYVQHILSPDILLFNWRNAPKHVGKTVYFDKADRPYICASFLLPMKNKRPDIIMNKFAWMELNRLRAEGYFMQHARQAVNQTNFNASQLNEVKIYCPPIDEQLLIVQQLEAEQEIIEANKRLIDLMQDKINQVMNRIYKCDA